MKKWISLFSLLAITGLVLSAFSSTASAQVLDNTWFKILVVTKGYSVGSMGDVRRAGAKAFVYMYVTWNDDDSEYNSDVWSETSDGGSGK
jgi:ABC-type phosphate transport system substrate-binding protein